MPATPRLALPLLAAGQAQKHVTLNDSLLRLDALVHLAVLDRDLAIPPPMPAADGIWIVGPAATGAWAGKENCIAIREEGGWRFETPRSGWQAHVADENLVVIWNGTAWVSSTEVITADRVGINTTADATNRLSVSSAATLLNHAGAGHQLKLNKTNAAATASLLFQSGFSGRAEMGLAGSDAFTVKISADGSTWQTALSLHQMTARAEFMADLTVNGVRVGRGPGGIASNIGIGPGALNVASGAANVALGLEAAFLQTTAIRTVALGVAALRSNLTGINNTAVGTEAGYANTGSANVFVGFQAGVNATAGGSNTAVGANSLASVTGWSNCAALGRNADVSGSNQVQLGDSATTVYAYGAVQSRSDARDKADIRDTVLGLDFILRLRPRDWRWDMRDDYRQEGPDQAAAGTKPGGRAAGSAGRGDRHPPRRLAEVQRSGSARRGRFHHGLVAQEVRDVITGMGVDFGGLQDHALAGGDEVLTLGYSELIGPLIRAVQELAARVPARQP